MCLNQSPRKAAAKTVAGIFIECVEFLGCCSARKSFQKVRHKMKTNGAIKRLHSGKMAKEKERAREMIYLRKDQHLLGENLYKNEDYQRFIIHSGYSVWMFVFVYLNLALKSLRKL